MSRSGGVILIPPSPIRDPLPRGLHKADIPDYLRSHSFSRHAGIHLPRRDFLVKFAATTALMATPIRPARAAGWPTAISIGIDAVSLAREAWRLGVEIYGQFRGENNTSRGQEGNVLLAILDEDDEVESSDIRLFKVPRNTVMILKFTKGPSARTRGPKTFQVAAEDDDDTFDFTAI
jgi:hypothetical protein